MTIATGVNKRLAYKVESTWGTVPAASGAQLLRRVSSDLTLKKQTFESNEILSTAQRQDFRHGVRSVEGTINGELSAGTWKDFIAAQLRRAFTTVTAISSLSITITGTGPTYTVARGAGSWLTDGIKVGQVGRLTAGSFNAANLNKNLAVLAVTASNLTVMPLNGVALVAEGPIASSTYTIPGKVTYAPQTGHTDLSYSIEHWFSDLSLSEVMSGCKTNETNVTIPPTGIATIGVGFLGKDLVTAGAQYFTSPTAETSFGLLASSNGILIAQGAAIAVLTGINFGIKGNMNGEAVVGSNTYADITEGRILVDGQMTALFDSATLRDIFLNETEASVTAIIAAGSSATADFLSFTMPRVKFGDAAKDDGDKAIVQTIPFTALENTAGGAGVSSERTTFYVQDSQA